MTSPNTLAARARRGSETEGRSTDELREIVSHVGAELELAPAEDIIEWALATFGEALLRDVFDERRRALRTSPRRSAPGIDVLFLDTGYHFAETIGTRDAVEATMPVNLISITPVQSVAEQDATYGKDLYKRDPDLCCKLRKVQPLAERLGGVRRVGDRAYVVPRPTTASSPPSSAGTRRSRRSRSRPLARWSDEDVERYIAENGILVNPLRYDGYPSIGCWPCTRRVAAGEDARSRPLGRQQQDRVRHPPVTVPRPLPAPPLTGTPPQPTTTTFSQHEHEGIQEIMTAPALITLAHGSRDPRSAATIKALVAETRADASRPADRAGLPRAGQARLRARSSTGSSAPGSRRSSSYPCC